MIHPKGILPIGTTSFVDSKNIKDVVPFKTNHLVIHSLFRSLAFFFSLPLFSLYSPPKNKATPLLSHDRNHTLTMEEGVQQGDPLGTIFFCLGLQGVLDPIFQEIDDPANALLLLLFVDDIFVCGTQLPLPGLLLKFKASSQMPIPNWERTSSLKRETISSWILLKKLLKRRNINRLAPENSNIKKYKRKYL